MFMDVQFCAVEPYGPRWKASTAMRIITSHRLHCNKEAELDSRVRADTSKASASGLYARLSAWPFLRIC